MSVNETGQAGDIPRPEHPRPDFQREPWINLNGRWRFTFDRENMGEQKRWYRNTHPEVRKAATTPPAPVLNDPFGDDIIVPFPWESQLSGIGEAEYRGAAWYQRVLVVPEDWAESDANGGPQGARGLPGMEDSAQSSTAIGAGVVWRKRPFLCFGAVDWSAKVWVNGRFVGEHYGGYTPFDLDLSQYVRPGKPATLTVRVWDNCDADTPLGKQTYNWYTPSSGIWQTVYLEGRPDVYIEQVHVTPQLEAGRALLAVTVRAAGDAPKDAVRLTVTSLDGSFSDATQNVSLASHEVAEAEVSVRLPAPRPWSPEDPHLYECAVKVGDDEIRTYFGLRSVTRERWGDNAQEFVCLNGEPVYLRGALDQAFHPDGLHTYPSDDAIRADIQLAKDLGLNMLRCHIKVNEPRYYYWADKLGVLMMYDLPSASIYTPTARANWEATFRGALARDFSHPCIFAWILFNETWGLEEHQTPASWTWVREMYDLAKSLDTTRLVEDNSACLYDHVKTDLNTWHFYISDYDRAKRHVEQVVKQTYEGSPFNYVGHRYYHVDGANEFKQGAEPFLNSEYAGLGASGGDKDISYSFKFLTTELRRHPKCCGYVYTELTDIEWEHNGLANYDRTRKEFGYDAFFPEMTVADLNGADFIGLDCPPCQTVPPGAAFAAPVFISHWDRTRPMKQARLRWRITTVDTLGESHFVDEGERMVALRRFDVVDAGIIAAGLPSEPCLATVAVWLEDDEHRIRARNYVNVLVQQQDAAENPSRTKQGQLAIRFKPGDYEDSSWPQPTLGPKGAKFGASGAGWVEYEIPLPDGVNADSVRGLQLVFEAGARTAASNRLGWRRPWQASVGNYPQTEERKFGTSIVVSVNGVALNEEPLRLPDDPADARGVLSLHNAENFEFGSYGFLNRLTADAETARRILEAATQDKTLSIRFEVPRTGGTAGGLNLYGRTLGAFPVEPTLLLDTGDSE